MFYGIIAIIISVFLCQLVTTLSPLNQNNMLTYRNIYSPNAYQQQPQQQQQFYRSVDASSPLPDSMPDNKQSGQNRPIQDYATPMYNNPNSINEIPKLKTDDAQKSAQLTKLVQQLYIAQAQVQLEATEIQRAQAIAGSAQQQLEESANNVRIILSALHSAQEQVASSALKAQSAQLQLAAHDQILFTSRQRVDALSAQMVGLQAEVGLGDEKLTVDIPSLLVKLKEPLNEEQKPKAIPSILPMEVNVSTHSVDDMQTMKNIPQNNVELSKRSSIDDIPQDSNKVTDEDIRGFLNYIRENPIIEHNIGDSSRVTDQKYISDFLTKIQKNDFINSPVVSENYRKNSNDKRADDETSRLSIYPDAEYFLKGPDNYIKFEPNYYPNSEILNDSLKAVRERRKKKKRNLLDDI